MEAERSNIIEKCKARLIELSEIRSRINFEEVSDIEHLRSHLKDLDDQLVILKHLIEHKQSTLVESEVKAYVEESERELETLTEEEAAGHSSEEEEPEIEAEPQEDEDQEAETSAEDQLDDEDIKEQEVALGVSGSSIHESHEDEDDQSLAKKLELQPIDDLKKAIGLNERFYYANELFQGDGKEYARAIEEFNHLSSIDDAQRLIDAKYFEKYHWDQHPEAEESLKLLLQRRYLKQG